MINLGDRSLAVQYIQNFLKDNYNKNIHLSDEYDKDTHKALIEYLQLPEVLDSYSMKDLILEKYTFREDQPPNALINGGGVWNFDFDITLDTIRFYNRPINQCFDGALRFISEYIEDIDELCRANGWYLANYTKFKYDNSQEITKVAEFMLVKESRKQLLPVKDIIKMINFSMNDYLLGKCFIDENNSYHGYIQDSNLYKISYIPAKPGDVFTISHGYKYACELAIGYVEVNINDLKHSELVSVNNIISHLSKSVYGEMNPGQYEIYEIPEDSECTYLVIQMPYQNNLISPSSQKITIKLGDINQDGRIDFDINNPQSDYMILKNYVENRDDVNTPTLTGASLVAANINKDIDINGNPVVDESDLKIFEARIKAFQNNGIAIDFGETIYEKEIDLTESDYDRLLVIYGNIEEGNSNNELNIPIEDYQTNPWSIHDCFLPYIYGSAIHTYSDSRDIEWLQKLIMKFQPRYEGLRWGYYDNADSFISNDYIKWNETKAKYEYFVNGLYTGYILSSNDIYNADLRRESNMTLSNIKILNGRILVNNEWTGKLVLYNGSITTELSQYSLKEIIKSFQLSTNQFYKHQTTEQIKFINGFVDPLTERRLKQATQGL